MIQAEEAAEEVDEEGGWGECQLAGAYLSELCIARTPEVERTDAETEKAE